MLTIENRHAQVKGKQYINDINLEVKEGEERQIMGRTG